MSNPFSSWNWRISLDEPGLARGSFALYGIPLPVTFQFDDFATSVTRTDGSQARHGYISCQLLFDDNLNPIATKRLRQFILNAQAGSRILYMTVDRGNATTSGADFIDIFGFPHLPEGIAVSAGIAGRRGIHTYMPFTLLLNNVTVVNDPSSYTLT
jgi:hypothetical protein